MVTGRDREEDGWEGEGDAVNPPMRSLHMDRQALELVRWSHFKASKY